METVNTNPIKPVTIKRILKRKTATVNTFAKWWPAHFSSLRRFFLGPFVTRPGRSPAYYSTALAPSIRRTCCTPFRPFSPAGCRRTRDGSHLGSDASPLTASLASPAAGSPISCFSCKCATSVPTALNCLRKPRSALLTVPRGWVVPLPAAFGATAAVTADCHFTPEFSRYNAGGHRNNREAG